MSERQIKEKKKYNPHKSVWESFVVLENKLMPTIKKKSGVAEAMLFFF